MQNNYFKPQYPKRLNNSKKDEAIEKHIERREKSIKSFSEKKAEAIAISSAFNMATEICLTLIKVRNTDMPVDIFWEEHEKWYQDYLARFLEKQGDDNYEEKKPKIEMYKDAILKPINGEEEVETPEEKTIQINDI